ncbi:hypothetical protein [Vibrio maerlii]|uniref:hypothetical protein n=1 Tax=Vibrio maerlii TaxID=2231648 RepID=UPI000E3CBB36|nr:hypothetical protein [Vibrio maerlii]
MKVSISMVGLISFTVLTACGGGGGGGGSSSSTPKASDVDGGNSSGAGVTPARAEDIVAARDFSFDVGETITLSLDFSDANEGALHLYYKAAFVKENGEVIPDPVSRVTTVYPDLTDEVELEVNGNWEMLYARWVPMNSSDSEQVWSLQLGQPSNSYHLVY